MDSGLRMKEKQTQSKIKSKQNVRCMNIIFYKLKSMSHLQNLDQISRWNGAHCVDGRRDSAMNKSFISTLNVLLYCQQTLCVPTFL